MRAVSPLGLFPILHSLRKCKNRLPLPVTGKFEDAQEECLAGAATLLGMVRKILAESTCCALKLKCFVVTYWSQGCFLKEGFGNQCRP